MVVATVCGRQLMADRKAWEDYVAHFQQSPLTGEPIGVGL
jgi:hypothetical protein